MLPDLFSNLQYLQLVELQKGKPLSLELVPCFVVVWVGATDVEGIGVGVVVTNWSRVVCLRPVCGVVFVVVGVSVGGGGGM